MRTKVIVVDDSSTARNQVSEVLLGAGYEVIEAADGHEGVTQVAAHPDAKMVVCDVNMPKMNGLEMLVAVKRGGQNAALRFLMLTTEAQPALVRAAKQGGASGWVIKPFKPELLLAAVRKLAG